MISKGLKRNSIEKKEKENLNPRLGTVCYPIQVKTGRAEFYSNPAKW